MFESLLALKNKSLLVSFGILSSLILGGTNLANAQIASKLSLVTDLSTVSVAPIRVKNQSNVNVDRVVTCFSSVPGVAYSSLGLAIFQPFNLSVSKLAAGVERTEYLRNRISGNAACIGSSVRKTVQSEVTKFSGILTKALFQVAGVASNLKAKTSLSQIFDAYELAYTSCGSLSLNSSKIFQNFNDCDIYGQSLDGDFDITLKSSTSPKVATLTFDALTDSVLSIDGKVETKINALLASTLDLEVTVSSVLYDVVGATSIEIDDTGLVLNGNGTVARTGTTLDFGFDFVDLHKSDDSSCYPDSGSIVFNYDSIEGIEVTFDEDTPTSKEATLSFANLKKTITLADCT